MTEAWDFIVVGAGSAGGTLAARLAARGVRVLLVEAGGWARSPYVHIPGFVYQAIGSRTLNWRYPGAGDPTLGGRVLEWAAGRAIGGSSAINGMVFVRGLPADFDAWAAAGNPGWGWDEVLPAFRRLERWHGAPSAARGENGPVDVHTFLEPNPACLAVVNGFTALGVPYTADYNAGVHEGIGLTQTNQRRGARRSVRDAYVDPARRQGLEVMTGKVVTRLIVENGRCTGIEVADRGRIERLAATREVVVSAGAIGSPKLLMLSGIGEPEQLAAHGIAVRHALRGVGANLNEHVNAMVSARVTVKTYDAARGGVRKLAHGLRWLRDREGPAASPANHLQAFVRTDPSSTSADIQVQTAAVGSFEPRGDGVQGVTAVVSLCRPHARGHVRLTSADPRAMPRIETALLSQAEDRRALLSGLRFVREALRIGPGGAFGEGELAPGVATRTDEEWLDYLRRSAGLNWHPTSTCRMGPTEDDVVDHRLRVHGLAGLRVADASIMPIVPSGNTNAPSIMIGEKAAELIAEDHALPLPATEPN